MEDRVCPICDTSNSPDAIHCEVCGEGLVPVEGEASDAAELAIDGGEVVGFAFEDSEEDEGELEFGATAVSDADEEPASPIASDDDADSTDEELMTAAPADETAAMDSFDAGDSNEQPVAEDAEEFDPASFDEPTGGMMGAGDDEDDDEMMAVSESQFDEDQQDGLEEFSDDQFADEQESDDDELEADLPAEPDFLYSPMDGTAYPRGSEEYEEGYGPDGEELVATPPDLGDDDDVASSLSEASGASMDDAELAAAAAPSPTVSAEFQAAFQARRKPRPVMAPLPQPGAYAEPAVLTVYSNRQPVMRLAIDMDEVLIGRRDPVADAYPDLDLTDLDPEAHLSRKHAYIYRQNKNYTLYAVSNAGTQLNSDLLDLGDRRALSDGDVIVLCGKIAMKFELPNA